MSESKFTPGPWHFTEQLESEGQAIYTVGYTDETGERTHDIRFIPPVSDWLTAHANAQLISAAPELLEACKGLKELLSNSDVRFKICDGGRGNLGEASWYHRVVNQASATIAKAEGRP